jgi:serine/threonine-protein kinase
MKTAGLIVGGVGIVGLGVGSVFALMAINKNSDSKQFCDPQDVNSCSQDGVTLRDDARAAGNIATAGFIVGGVALAAGVALVLLAPSSSKSTAIAPLVSPNAGGLVVRGGF